MDLNLLLYPTVAILIYAWFFMTSDLKMKRIAKYLNKLPGPRKFPFIGTNYELIGTSRRDFWRTIVKISQDYWPIWRSWNGSVPESHLIEADHFETVLRSSVNINKGYIYIFLQPWLGTGLLISKGQKWLTHRKLITPTFHFTILENFLEVFVEKCQILVNKLEKEVGNTKGFNVCPYITRCTLDIICETAMGTEINAQDDTDSSYVSAVHSMSELVLQRFIQPWLQYDFIYYNTKDGKRYKRSLHLLHSFTKKVIRERKEALKQKTKNQRQDSLNEFGKKRRVAFLDLLLEAAEGGAALSDEDLREEVDTFMFEGHDTTSASLCWTLFLLGSHPHVQELVFEEQRAIFGTSDRQPNMQDLAEMKYLERVIKESLRLYPSVPVIQRELTEDVEIGEYTLPAGSHVMLHIYQAHRRAKYFPDPEKFDPDNFLPERVQGRHPYAYVPFSAGSRNCIGQKFALLEEKTVLSAVMRHFRVRALDKPEDIALLGEIILRSADGIRLVIERR